MTRATSSLSLLFALCLLPRASFCPPPAFAEGEEPPPAPAPQPAYTDVDLLREIAAGESKNGTYGQAYDLLSKIYAADDATKGMKLEAARGFLLKKHDLALAVNEQMKEATAQALLANPQHQSVVALLLDATARPASRQALLARYEKLKADGVVKNFDEFVLELAKNARDSNIPPNEKLVHLILTQMGETKPPPERKPGEGEESPPGGGRERAGRAADRLRSYWNADEVYGKLGDPNVIQMGDRIVTFNIVTEKDETGKMVQKLAVYDRTNTSDIHGWTFDFSDPKLKTAFSFQLDGRENSVNPAKYSIQIVPAGNDFKIVFSDAKGQKAAVPTINELFRHRAQKVRDHGYVVKVGDREYYLGAEGHSDIGQNTFWTKEMLAKLDEPDFDPKNLAPQMASASVKREGGRDIPIPRASIGQVGGKWYDQKWNPEKGEMEVVEGLPPAGDLLGGGPGGDSGFGHPTERSKGELAGWPDLSQQGIFPDKGLNAKLASGAAAKAKFYFKAGEIGKIYLMFDKDVKKMMPVDLKDVDVLPVGPGSAQGHVMAWRGKTGAGESLITFLDLRKDMPLETDERTGRSSFKTEGATVGTLNLSKKEFASVKDTSVALFVMTALGFPQDEILKMISTARAAIPDAASYQFDGRQGLATLSGGGKHAAWKDGKWVIDASGGDIPGADSLVGQNAVLMDRGKFVLSQADEKAKLPDKFSENRAVGGETVKAEYVALSLKDDNQQPDKNRLFLAKSADGTKKVWYMTALIRSKQGDLKRVDFPVFSDPPLDKLLEFPGASKLVARGIDYPEDKIPENTGNWHPRVLRPGGASFKDKGVLAVFDGEAGKYPNVVGVLAYWGMSYEEAKALAERQRKSS